jgi:hypothetical protein
VSAIGLTPATGDIELTREALLERRVLTMWPRFDRAAIRRCGHDPRKVAALVGRRTSMSEEAIVRLLTMPAVSDDDVGTWFG